MTRAWLVFVAIAVVMAFLLACVHTWIWGTGLSAWIAVVSLFTGAVLSGFLSTRHLRRWFATFWLRADRIDQVFFVILATTGIFCMLQLTGVVQGVWQTSNPDNLGDLPLHVHFINFFARGAPFPPANPIYAGEPLRYAYAMDLWDALWVRLGASPHATLIVTGSISVLVTLIALWRAGGVMFMAAFFFSGGVVSSLYWDQGFGPGSTLDWKNLFYAVFVTQRGFWWALPAGVDLIRKWTRFLEHRDAKLSPSFVLIWAVLPFFHLHSFVVLSLWMGLTALAGRRFPWKLFWFSPIPLFFILRSLSPGNVEAALGWNWGWTFTSVGQFFRNFAVWLAIPMWLTLRWARQKRWTEGGIAVVLTFLAFNVRLAPWPWDQIKVLLWVYLLWTFWAIREFKWDSRSAFVLSLILFWPGILQWISGWPSMTGRFEVQNWNDRAMVAKLLEDVPVTDVVAARVDTRHPLYGLGQSLAMGYPAAVWSHGLPLGPRQVQLDAFLRGTESGPTAAQEMGVKWIVWNDNEESSASVPTWQGWGWSEKRKEGPWHLWQKTP